MTKLFAVVKILPNFVLSEIGGFVYTFWGERGGGGGGPVYATGV